MALLWVAVAFLCGLVLGDALLARGLLGCGWPGWLWLIPATLVPLTPLLRRLERVPAAPLPWPGAAGFRAPRKAPSLALAVACTLAAAMGLARIAAQPVTPCWSGGDLAYYNEPAARAWEAESRRRTVEGFISRYVPASEGGGRIYVAASTLDGRPVKGALTLTVRDTSELAYGLPVRVRGILATPPDFAGFSYRTWLARHSVHSQMTLARVDPLPGPLQGNPLLRRLYALRRQGELLIRRSLPEPYAALAAGILLGIDASIPDDVQQQFNDTSASHVLVISGSNVALITGVLLALSAALAGPRAGFLLALAGIALYTFLVGAEPSVLRAALMGALFVLAARLGRAATALVSLAFAALILGLIDPHIVWDVGFQLSALATAGLILIAPKITHGASTMLRLDALKEPAVRRSARFLVESLAVTLAASLAVLPLLLHTFERLSIVGLFTNLLIVPVQPLVLFAGSGALLAGLAGLLPVAQALFWAAWLGLAWTLAVVQWSASLRWASLAVGGFGAGALVGTYALLGLLLWQARTLPAWEVRRRPARPGWSRRLASPAVMGALAVCAALLWIALRTLPDGRLHLWLLPAERSAAVLIQTPAGRQVLVDGGDDPSALLTELGTVMPFWDRSLDLMILTRAEARTAATQRALPERLRVDAALRPETGDTVLEEWQRGLAAFGIPVTTTAAAGWIDLGDGAALWTVTSPASADDALALHLVYGDFRLLLAGTPRRTAALAPELIETDALVLSEAEAAAPLLAAVSPELVIAYGDASLETEVPVLDPGSSGRIHLWSDGIRWWVDPSPPAP